VKSVLRFLRTTLTGGILFLLPIIIVVVILDKALVIANQIVAPLANHLPVHSLIGLETPKLLAIGLLILFCFLAGFCARVVIAQKAVNWLEEAVLSNVPGYEFIKSASRSFFAVEKEQDHSVVLARIGDAWQIAFLVERLEGGHVAVFVPNAPSPQSGQVYFMTEDRTRHVEIPRTAALKCLTRYGMGSTALLGNRLEEPAATALGKPTAK